MLDKLTKLFQPADPVADTDPVAREQRLRVATAALLVEMSRADFDEDDVERDTARKVLSTHFDLDAAEATELLGLADSRADEAVSLHEFTNLLHQHLPVEDKHEIVRMLWSVALADARLDKHEEHLVRKVAGLLYVSHSDLMRIKHRVLGELSDD